MAYATVDDLIARGITLESGETDVAETLLEDVAVKIDRKADGREVDDSAALIVSCNVVARMLAPLKAGLYGVTQTSMTAGSYQQQMTYTNPTGDMYFTKQDLDLLGFGGGRLAFARPSYGRLEPDDD